MHKLAFLFPGQGSQQPGMGRFLFDQFPIAKKTFHEASEALGFSMEKLCFEGSPDELALTKNTQPALLTVSIATARVLNEHYGLQPSITAGHSVGEYASMVLAEAMDFADAIKSVRLRGEAMQAAVPVGQGGMVAVLNLDPAQIEQLCAFVEKKSGFAPIGPANFNAPGQIVVSGNQQALDWMVQNFKAADLWPESTPRCKLIPLQVSAPFHCTMMAPAEIKMREWLNQIPFKDAKIPIIQNLTALQETKATSLKENLIRQVSGSVRWMQSMETLKSAGFSTCIEVGTGKVLQGLLKKIDSQHFQVFNTQTLEDLEMIGNWSKGS